MGWTDDGGAEGGNRDLKILCCYYQMRRASTDESGEVGKERPESEVRLTKSEKKEPTRISRMGRPISKVFLIDGNCDNNNNDIVAECGDEL